MEQIPLTVEGVRNSRSGPVLLLGSGPSANYRKASEWADLMPSIAVNDSWRWFPYAQAERVFVDLPMQGGRTHVIEGSNPPESSVIVNEPQPTIAYTCLHPSNHNKVREKARIWPDTRWLVFDVVHRNRGEDVEFRGLRMNEGTHGYAGGILALEVATWLGHDPIFTLGYDFVPGPRCFGGEKKVKEKTAEAWKALFWKAKLELERNGRHLVRIK